MAGFSGSLPRLPQRLAGIRPSVLLLGLAWSATLLLWLLDTGEGPGAPAVLDRLVVLSALGGTAAALVRAGLRLWRRDGASRLLLALVLLCLVLSFAGLDHEVTGRDFGDEGTYRAQAERINGEGQLLRPWFVYPHLLFYLDALALWIAGLFPGPIALLAHLLYGVEGALPTSVLVTRGVTALLGGLVPAPVFVAARRVAGDGAAVAAAALAAVSPLWVELAHLNLSDVAAAFFATLAVARASALLDEERSRDYLLAGLWTGLAAGSKYPAGIVAVAIAALWLRWRLRTRRMGLGVLWAGLVSLAAFLATTPSLLAFPAQAFGGEAGVFFGFRLYSEHGWAGVVQPSNTLYYGALILANFGWPALAVGVAGLTGLGRKELARLAWLLPFPCVHLALLASLEMALERNLLPLLPQVAVLLGCGAAGAWSWLRRAGLRLRTRAVLAGALAAGALALPAYATAAEVLRLSRPTTREEASAWMERNLPPGSFLVQEAYTPRLAPEWRFPARHPRFAIRLSREELEDPTYDFLLLAGGSYNRFLRFADDPGRASQARRYRELFERYELVRQWRPGRFQGGSEIRLHRLDPAAPPWTDRRAFAPGDALLRSPEMAPGASGEAIRYTGTGQWSLFKEYLVPGRYRLRLATGAATGRVEVRDRTNRVLAEGTFHGRPTLELELPERAKCFLYAELPPGSRLRGLTLRRLPASPTPPPPDATDTG